MTKEELKIQLTALAEQYETSDFLIGDPSWFMHQVQGRHNQEVMAFLASCLSFGSRPLFMKKIQWLLDSSNGDIDNWVRSGGFHDCFQEEGTSCFYRFYTWADMEHLLQTYRSLLAEYDSLGDFVRKNGDDGFKAIAAICRYFSAENNCAPIPKNTQSACKRICMFLRWMVRGGSPVDLGLWEDFIDRRTLIMPLDTHVVKQSCRLGLLNSQSASMSVAKKLTDKLAEFFPDDPLKGDFALFGYGVNSK